MLSYPGLLLKEGTGLVSFLLIGKAVRLIRSINVSLCIVMNSLQLLVLAGCSRAGHVPHNIKHYREDGIFFFV